ncbi:olfactory receptor 14J1-like [Dipodomys spectabilis]|uniref:olfactory receptor 14J1-like n=1 Tax=Dipodomys spectabilis TaxID=105255 RepID=UPI001C547B87|nr:olfactory receptor 14J1-like [Dipodomys spectabilis]
MTSTNETRMNGFLLMGLSENHNLQLLHACLFLVMYLLALTSNFTIITITTLDEHLQSPMYYFLKQLSLLDLSFISVTVPQSISNSLTGNSYISYGQCMLQVFFFTSFASAEVAILTVMSYDYYVAICFPLHYELIMDARKCNSAMTAVWVSGGMTGTLYTRIF